MRRINPVPELLLPGKWKKQHMDKEGRVNMRRKEYFAPLDTSVSSAHTRNHEYFHIKYSPDLEELESRIRTLAWSNDLSEELLLGAIRCIEDDRVNYLGGLAGVRVNRSAEDIQGVSFKPTLMATSVLSLMYLSSRAYDRNPCIKAIEDELNRRAPELAKLCDDIVEDTRARTDRNNPKDINTFEDTVMKNAVKFSLAVQEKHAADNPRPKGKPTGGAGEGDEEKEKEKAKENMKRAASNIRDEISLSQTYDNPALGRRQTHDMTFIDKFVKTPKKIQHDYEEQADFGKLVVMKTPQLKRLKINVKVSTKKMPSHEGAYIRYHGRLATDKKIFSDVRKFAIGAILVDWSGSMGFTSDTLYGILKYCPGATVLVYSGGVPNSFTGKIITLAKDGKVFTGDLDEIHNNMGPLNIVDGPALEVLAKMRGKKFWISDGQVTGIGERTKKEMMMKCLNIKRKHHIKQIYDIKTLERLLATGKLGRYKDPAPLSILNPVFWEYHPLEEQIDRKIYDVR